MTMTSRRITLLYPVPAPDQIAEIIALRPLLRPEVEDWLSSYIRLCEAQAVEKYVASTRDGPKEGFDALLADFNDSRPEMIAATEKCRAAEAEWRADHKKLAEALEAEGAL